MTDLLYLIGKLTHESEDFDYDSIGMSEDNLTLGIGFMNNSQASIMLHALEDRITVSFHHKTKPYEALKFFIGILEQIPTKIVVINDFN